MIEPRRDLTNLWTSPQVNRFVTVAATQIIALSRIQAYNPESEDLVGGSVQQHGLSIVTNSAPIACLACAADKR